MGRDGRRWGKRGLWVIAAVAIGVLLFQGHHLAHLLPRMEAWVRSLGPAAPLFFFVAVVVLEPVFFPNTLFGMTAGVVFGLWKGFLIYFFSVYMANLIVYLIGRRLLREPVLRGLEGRPQIRSAVAAAETQGTSLVFWIRLLPLNPAVFSYAFGGVRVPFRAVAIGTLGMFPHMFFDVYLGEVAAHVTEMAGAGHADWEAKGFGLVLGLVAAGVLSVRVARIARNQIHAAGVVDAP
ncbi:MAG: VTT domain-containing protein [Myxococcota bacterium]